MITAVVTVNIATKGATETGGIKIHIVIIEIVIEIVIETTIKMITAESAALHPIRDSRVKV